jgi:hypothetical protein
MSAFPDQPPAFRPAGVTRLRLTDRPAGKNAPSWILPVETIDGNAEEHDIGRCGVSCSLIVCQVSKTSSEVG